MFLTQGAADDEAWFQERKSEYAGLFSEIDALEKKWRGFREARVDEQKVIAVEREHFEVEKKIWDLDTKVKSRASGLRDLRIQIDKTGKKLYKLCDENKLNKSVAACTSAAKTETEYRAAMSAIRKAFDELRAYRQTKKI